MMSQKTREDRVRRVARRQGLVVRKSRRRDPRRADYRRYWLIDAERNLLVYGDQSGAELEDIEAYLGQR